MRFMYKQEAVLENETHKVLRDFEIHIDYLISARWPDLVIVNTHKKKKRTGRKVDFAVMADHKV